jgi:hypothetical protein
VAAPSDVQLAVLEALEGYRIIMQDTHGGLLVAPGERYEDAKVIDTSGQIHTLDRYMALRRAHCKRSPHSLNKSP